MTTSIRLPIHMLATRPQNRSGLFWMTCGPGTMPWIIIAPTISAMTAFGGMPSVSRGMKLVCAPALLADSGPETACGTPLPKSCGRSEMRFSSA